MNWNNISLYKFQQIEAINERKDLPDIDKTLFSTCVVFDYTDFELDNLPFKKVEGLTNKVAKIFTSELKPRLFKRIGKYFINYEISKITLGQYIELAFFLSGKPLQNAQYALASLSNLPLLKNNAKHHRIKAEYFLRQPVTKILGCIEVIIQNFKSFNNEYAGLFGLDKEIVNPGAIDDKFNKRYGWIYSASQVAEYERIKLSEAFGLPIRQAFNDLAYLKAKNKYEAEQLNKK